MPQDDLVNQGDIEKLLAQSTPGAASSGGTPEDEPPTPPSEGEEPAGGAIDQSEIEAMLSAGARATDASPDASADADKLLAQDDIEKLLSQAAGSGLATQAAKKPPAPVVAQPGPLPGGQPGPTGEGAVSSKDVEYLLDQAQRAIASIDSPFAVDAVPGISGFRLDQFTGATASSESATLDLLRDVDLNLQIELGRTHMYLEEVLKLRKGSVVPLDKLAGDPVDIYVNGRLIARGEVLVLNDNFCVRVAELIAGVGA